MSAAQQEFDDLMRDKERRSRHPEDDDEDARSFLHLSDDEGDRTPQASHADQDEAAPRPSMSRSHVIPTTRYNANTGPKGVISDAQNFRDSRRQHRTSMRSSSTLAVGVTGALSIRDPPPTVEKTPEADEEEFEEEEDMEDDFMQQWRRTRLAEMQNKRPDSQLHQRGSSKRLWGTLTTVDGGGYLDAVDKSPSDTVVVVYIYDDHSDVSAATEECLRDLAKRHIDTRFVRLHYQDAEMEPAGVPALIAYRGGDKFAGLVPVIDEIPDDADLSSRTLEAVMKRYKYKP